MTVMTTVGRAQNSLRVTRTIIQIVTQAYVYIYVCHKCHSVIHWGFGPVLMTVHDGEAVAGGVRS